MATFASVDPAGLPALIEAIRHMHGATATWLESVPVHEKTPNGETVWDGEVQRFALKGHPKAAECFAWSHATQGNKRRFHAVLRLPPVDSAAKAVQTAILAEYQMGQRAAN